MLKDITLGQYIPGKSVIHRLDPRLKLVLTIAYIAVLFAAKGPASYALVFGSLVLLIALSDIGLRFVFRSIRPLLFIILFTAVLNMFYVPGEAVWSWWIFTITKEGIRTAIYMALRIAMLISGTFVLLNYTTQPIMLTDGIEQLLGPLKKIHVPVHELAMMMTIALRFIPTLIEETDKIMSAQKARGADFETGNIVRRAKALVPILVPLFVSAFRRADDLAVAMECRCYRGSEGRTRLHTLKLQKIDYLTAGAAALLCAGIVLLGIYV